MMEFELVSDALWMVFETVFMCVVFYWLLNEEG